MAQQKFLMVSLKEDQAKKLAQVISNDTCRMVIDHLTEHSSTESEIAKTLNIPISTVHYNIQQLIQAGLVVSEEFHYSPKGKEVLHYKLANKYSISAPQPVWGIKEKLKAILPVFLLTAGVAFTLQWFSQSQAAAPALMAEKAMQTASLEQVMAAAPVMEAVSQPLAIGWWFFGGAVAAIVLYLLIDYVMHKAK